MQYAKAMGLHVVAIDVADEKLAPARSLGAEVVVNARRRNATSDVLKQTGGRAHGVVVTAVSIPAFSQALQIVRAREQSAWLDFRRESFRRPSSTSC